MTVSHIIVILSTCDFIDDLKIIEINVEPPVQSIKARANLKNGFLLQITESIGEDFRRYSYHLQDGDTVIKRWDNAPHWKDIRTYPFHTHVKDQEIPLESKEMFVSDVIDELKKMVLESNKKVVIEETLRKLDIGNEDMRELEKIRGDVWKREKKNRVIKSFKKNTSRL